MSRSLNSPHPRAAGRNLFTPTLSVATMHEPMANNNTMHSVSDHTPLLADVRLLIDCARQRVASAVNAELAQQLTVDFGKGWSEQQLRHCLRLAAIFPDEQILSTVRRELSWSHFKTLIIRVADYLTLLPPRETLQAKLHQSIELARAKMASVTK
jgi:hypothetical protein